MNAADELLNISLGIWPVRAEGEALALALQARLGGTIYRPWLNPDVAQMLAELAADRAYRIERT